MAKEKSVEELKISEVLEKVAISDLLGPSESEGKDRSYQRINAG